MQPAVPTAVSLVLPLTQTLLQEPATILQPSWCVGVFPGISQLCSAARSGVIAVHRLYLIIYPIQSPHFEPEPEPHQASLLFSGFTVPHFFSPAILHDSSLYNDVTFLSHLHCCKSDWEILLSEMVTLGGNVGSVASGSPRPGLRRAPVAQLTWQSVGSMRTRPLAVPPSQLVQHDMACDDTAGLAADAHDFQNSLCLSVCRRQLVQHAWLCPSTPRPANTLPPAPWILAVAVAYASPTQTCSCEAPVKNPCVPAAVCSAVYVTAPCPLYVTALCPLP